MTPRRRQKSLIPPKAQIPVMIVGAIVLVILLIWQIGKVRKQRAGAATPPVTAQTTPPTTTAVATSPLATGAADARALLAEARTIQALMRQCRDAVRQNRAIQTRVATPRRAPVRNPFLVPPPRVEPVPIASKTTDSETTRTIVAIAPWPEGPSREERLESIDLIGTCVMGGATAAIVNSGVLRKGDSVEGFVVLEITEREMTLEDDQGRAAIRMKGISGL